MSRISELVKIYSHKIFSYENNFGTRLAVKNIGTKYADSINVSLTKIILAKFDEYKFASIEIVE